MRVVRPHVEMTLHSNYFSGEEVQAQSPRARGALMGKNPPSFQGGPPRCCSGTVSGLGVEPHGVPVPVHSLEDHADPGFLSLEPPKLGRRAECGQKCPFLFIFNPDPHSAQNRV